MSHLEVFVEGDLEEAIIENFLKTYWQKRFKTIHVVNYKGEGSLKVQFASDAVIQLVAEPDSTVLCLVDLYQESFLSDKEKSGLTVAQYFAAVQKQMNAAFLGELLKRFDTNAAEKIRLRFGAFPVVMETETWLCVGRHPAPEGIRHPATFLKEKIGYNKEAT